MTAQTALRKSRYSTAMYWLGMVGPTAVYGAAMVHKSQERGALAFLEACFLGAWLHLASIVLFAVAVPLLAAAKEGLLGTALPEDQAREEELVSRVQSDSLAHWGAVGWVGAILWTVGYLA